MNAKKPGATNTPDVAADQTTGRKRTNAITIVGVVPGAIFGAFVVWFAGFDYWWSVAAVFALGSVGAFLAMLTFEEQGSWSQPTRNPPRGVGLTLPMMEESLAACDRLARPLYMRHVHAVLTNERDDRLARGTLLRKLRALLGAELRACGVTPAKQTDEAVIELLGVNALAVLQPSDDTPVTSAVIARCLDAVERLANKPFPPQ
ncbi:MAG: hypothetical protein ACO1Q7_17305 [Gemmatimonas sp.]